MEININLECPKPRSKTMFNTFSRFLKDESGATAIEYGLIAALIAVALITGATALGSALNKQFKNVSNKLNVT